MAEQKRIHNPATVFPPFGDLYSHGVEIPAGARLLFIAGQVGVDRQGNSPESVDGQLSLAWNNIGEILKSAGMGMEDIIKVVCFLKDPMYEAAFARSCKESLRNNKLAMTAPIVRQLWSPEWYVEIEAIAAKID